MKQVHGGDVYRHPGVLDFSSNMNPLGTPEAVIEAGKAGVEKIADYPDVFQTELLDGLSAYEKVPASWLIAGNGAAELIFALAFSLKPRKALIFAPTFAEYEAALRAAECDVSYCTLSEENGFQPNETILNQLSADLDLVILCNPNNPTGALIEPALMNEVIKKCEQNHIFLMVDECFQDFIEDSEKYSICHRLSESTSLFILKAFTKRYAMAGIRLGYGLTANTALIEKMHQVIQPWNVSIPAQMAGVAALKETVYVDRARALIKKERGWLKQELKNLGFTVFDSKANYIFFRGPHGLVEHALQHGVLIRDCSNYKGLCEGYYRVAVRTHEENEVLIRALAIQ